MELIYNMMENLLPFQFISYDFMKNALLAMFIITPLFGILGTMIVNNKLAFFSDALGHSAFTGIAIGVLLGVSNTNISMIVFAILFAFVLNWIKRRNTIKMKILFFQKTYNSEISKIILTIRIYRIKKGVTT